MTIDDTQTPTAPNPLEEMSGGPTDATAATATETASGSTPPTATPPTGSDSGDMTASTGEAPVSPSAQVAADTAPSAEAAPMTAGASAELAASDATGPTVPMQSVPASSTEAAPSLADASETPTIEPSTGEAPANLSPSSDAAEPVQASNPLQASGQPMPSDIPSGDAPGGQAMNTPASEANAGAADAQAAPETPPAQSAPTSAPTDAPAKDEPKPELEVKAADDLDLFDRYMTNPASVDVEVSQVEGGRHAKGDRVEGEVTEVKGNKVFLNIGSKADATVPEHELSKPASEHNPGDKMFVVVIKPEGGDSGAMVSRKKAEQEEQWDNIVKAFEEKTSITANVVERVKGGLTVDLFGIRGFVPATHVGNGKIRNLDRFAGTELELKVIELDKERKKVVLSNREAEAESRASKKDEIFGKLKVDDVLEGTVRRLTDYGAFVDLGGVDGLLHISEMSWARIGHPKEIFKEGDTIPVKVLRLDKGAEKISLGHKQVLPDPWNAVKTNYTVGQTLTIPITRLVASGAFIRLPEGAEAFMPVSEMSDRRINDPSEVLEPGQEAEVKIIELKPEARRMVLSIRATKPGYEPRPDTSGYRGEPDFRNGGGRGPGGPRRNDRGGGAPDEARRGIATGGATIGERLGMLKGLLGDGGGGREGGAREGGARKGKDEGDES